MQCEDFPENELCVSEAKRDTKETVEATLECPEEMRVSCVFVLVMLCSLGSPQF